MLSLNLTEEEYNIAQLLFVQKEILPLPVIDLPIVDSIKNKLEVAYKHEKCTENT